MSRKFPSMVKLDRPVSVSDIMEESEVSIQNRK